MARRQPDVSPYTNCFSLIRSDVLEALDYDPESGVLRWKKRTGHGGARSGSRIVSDTLSFQGTKRNTFGIICLIMAARLPEHRLPYRDENRTNWTWENIRPEGWR